MLDHVTDKNHAVLYALYKTVSFPEFVKTASIHDTEDASGLSASAFADELHKRYPIDTPADTWLSNLFFQKVGKEQYTPARRVEIQETLDKAAKLWNIDLNYCETPIQKTASTAQAVIEFKQKDLPLFKIQVNAPQDLEKIAADITHNYRKYTYDTRKQVARQLLSTASEFNYSFSPDWQNILEKTASYGVSDETTVVAALQKRKRFLQKNAAVCEKIDTAITSVKGLCKDPDKNIFKPSVMEKIATFVDAIDRLTDLHQHPAFTQGAEQDLFRITPTGLKTINKTATITNNHLFSNQKLAENKDKVAAYVKDVCGKEDIKQLTKSQLIELNTILQN